jgi:phosphoglucosamine mutase
MALLKSSNKTASKALRRFKLYPQISRAISVKDKIPLEQLDGYKKLLEELDSKNIRHIIRYSGTEQKLRITLESKDNSLIEKEIETTISFFKQSLTVTGN